MEIFSFMRKPLKPLLYGTLLALLCTVALIFFLQYRIDRQTLDEWLSDYAYTGMLYPDTDGEAVFTPLPEKTQSLLKEADTIASLHSMQTYAAKLTDGYLVPDCMMSFNQLQQHFFIQAKVAGSSFMRFDGFEYDRYAIEIVQEWGSDKIGDRSFGLTMLRLPDEPAWEIGQEVFFISDYVLKNGAICVVEFEIYTPAAREALTGQPITDVFLANPYLLLKEGEGEEEIRSFMEQTGIAPLYEKFVQLDGNLAVRAIDDFYALPKTAEGRLHLTEGRVITQGDAGKKVCMVSQNLANRNRYAVGDIVTLSIAEENYSLNGWENGNPMPEDALITSYAEEQEYEIVGIYNQIARDMEDPLYYSHTDIFVPVKSECEKLALPYAFSFRVSGLDYDAFCSETLPLLEGSGCNVRLTDTGWQNIEDAFYAVEIRCKLMFWCAVFAFFIAAVVFSVLLFLHLRKEYGLLRLMGAYRHEACQVYFAAVAVIAVPALLISSIAGWLIVKNLLQNGSLESVFLSFLLLPTTLLAAICVFLFLLLAVSERGSIRKIIM